MKLQYALLSLYFLIWYKIVIDIIINYKNATNPKTLNDIFHCFECAEQQNFVSW